MTNLKDLSQKNVYLSVRIREADRALLEAICIRGGWNLSDGVRRAINSFGAEMSLFLVDGELVSVDLGGHNAPK